MSAPCQVCGTETEDTCVRCEKPTCDAHFFEQEHLGLCEPCREELDAQIAAGRMITNWPFPLRQPLPGMGQPPEVPDPA